MMPTMLSAAGAVVAPRTGNDNRPLKFGKAASTNDFPQGGKMEQVLQGVRVVEVAQWWFVPAGGAVLADWGADVLKVEHPVSGDPMRGLMTSGLVPNTGGVNFMVEQPNRGSRVRHARRIDGRM